MRGGGPAPHFSTPGAKATDFSRFGAHLCPAHFSRFDPKVPHLATSTPGHILGRSLAKITHVVFSLY